MSRWSVTPDGMAYDGIHALDAVIWRNDRGLVATDDSGDTVLPDDPEERAEVLADLVGAAQVPAAEDVIEELEPDGIPRDAAFWAEMFARYGDGLLEALGRGLVDGGSFLFDIPAGTPAVWGKEGHVLWAEGEPLMIAGPQGVGKTSDAGQVALGLCGVPGFEELYGLPITPVPEGKRVAYFALDRPRQIARALRRMAPPEHRELIAERLIVWQGPLPFSLLSDSTALRKWCEENAVAAVIIDSLKDVAGKLSDEEVGAKINAALQDCITRGIETLVLHHNRKANADNRRPKTLADVHGSENLTRGVGSVICLFGAAGDTEIELSHLKQPAETVGPFVLARDHETGRSEVAREGSLGVGSKAERVIAVRNYFIQAGGPGTTFTLKELVEAGLGGQNVVREALAKITAEGWLECHEGGGRGNPTTWTMIPPHAHPGRNGT